MNVLVLLSSWNGAAYIGEQIASILNQQFDGDLRLLIRDDGSDDDTVAIVESAGDPRIEVVRGARFGAKGSFLALLGMALERDADFIALADQDDVWEPGKLARAIAQLTPIRGPAIYGSALRLVDERLNSMGTYEFADAPHFEGAAFANCITGCTAVLNRPLLMLLDPLPRADAIMMHDWWLYLVGAAFGTVIYDTTPSILYRQHLSNQVGLRRGGIEALLHRTRRFLNRSADASRLTQAREFLDVYRGRLTKPQKEFLEAMIACEHAPVGRMRFAVSRRPRRRETLEEIVCFTKCAVGWF